MEISYYPSLRCPECGNTLAKVDVGMNDIGTVQCSVPDCRFFHRALQFELPKIEAIYMSSPCNDRLPATEADFAAYEMGERDLWDYCICSKYPTDCRFHCHRTVTRGPHNALPSLELIPSEDEICAPRHQQLDPELGCRISAERISIKKGGGKVAYHTSHLGRGGTSECPECGETLLSHAGRDWKYFHLHVMDGPYPNPKSHSCGLVNVAFERAVGWDIEQLGGTIANDTTSPVPKVAPSLDQLKEIATSLDQDLLLRLYRYMHDTLGCRI